MLDLPGVTAGNPIREATPATQGGTPDLQVFRGEEGFDGPSLWLEQGGSAFGTDGAIEGEGETIALWQATGEAVVDFRTSLDRDGTLAALEALRPVDEATWLEQFPPE